MADTRLEPLVLSEDERRTLENWVKLRSTAQGLALRARIVLACAQGGSNLAVAARLGVNRHTVSKWRARFLRDRLDGLPGEPRPGVPRTITDAQVEEVVVRTLEEVPEGATHWSKRELARRAGISPASVRRIWRAFGLQPWRTETFKISPDPLLIDKIRDVAGLYLAPPANAAVFSVDEKPQIQALERTAPVLPMLPGGPERRSFDYVRHGTIDLFAALNIATGKVIGKLSAQHRAVDFRDFLDQIDRQTDPALAVHVICDNLSARKAPPVQRWLLARPRFVLHFTPAYASWINQVERWLAELQRRCLERGVFCSLDELTTALEEWIKLWNESARPFKWTSGQITYDLRRLRVHGLIERIPHSFCYQVTTAGIRQALFLTRLTQRLLIPGLADLTDPKPAGPLPAPRRRPRLRRRHPRPNPPGQARRLTPWTLPASRNDPPTSNVTHQEHDHKIKPSSQPGLAARACGPARTDL